MADIAAGADGVLPGIRTVGVPASDWETLAAPGNREAAAMGLLWLLRGNDLAARAAFARVVGDVHLLRYLDSVAAVRLGDREGAMSALAATAAALPDFYPAQVMMGELEISQGRLPEALAHHRNAAAQVEKGGVLMRIGLIADRLEEVAIAEDALRRFIALFPDSHIAHNQLAWLFIQREIRLDDALTLANEANRLQPGNASVLDNMGWIRVLQGNAWGALDILREANRISAGTDPDIVNHLAFAEAEAGSEESARDLRERLAELGTEKHSVFAKVQELRERLR